MLRGFDSSMGQKVFANHVFVHPCNMFLFVYMPQIYVGIDVSDMHFDHRGPKSHSASSGSCCCWQCLAASGSQRGVQCPCKEFQGPGGARRQKSGLHMGPALHADTCLLPSSPGYNFHFSCARYCGREMIRPSLMLL